MTTKKNLGENELKKIIFRIRVPQGSDSVKFGVNINGIRKDYEFVDGEQYVIPQYMIDLVNSRTITETYTSVSGPKKVVKLQQFYCEPID